MKSGKIAEVMRKIAEVMCKIAEVMRKVAEVMRKIAEVMRKVAEVMWRLCIFSKVCLSKMYFCEMYPTCVSSKLCEFIYFIFCKFKMSFMFIDLFIKLLSHMRCRL